MGFQRMNKRGAELKMAFFAVVVFSVIMIAISINVSEWGTNYGVEDNAGLSEYDKLQSISDTANSQRGSISPDDPDPGQDAEATTFRSVFGILTNIFEPFKAVFGSDGMLETARAEFGIPSYIIQAIVTMMIISLIFTLVYIIFRLGKQ